MFIKLFDIKDRVAIPTEHCYVISWLNNIIKEYPLNYMKIFAYLQYTCSLDPEANPYLQVPAEDKEEAILRDIECDFEVEDELIQEAKKNCDKLYDTPMSRSYKSAKIALDNINYFLANNKVSTGKDGTGDLIDKYLTKLPAYNSAYNQAEKDFLEETKTRVRGDKFISEV